MPQNECTIMLLNPIMNFNLMNIIIFPIFHEHKYTKLNHFSPISKVVNFLVLIISLTSFEYLPSIRAFGGSIIFWKSSMFAGSLIFQNDFALSVILTSAHNNSS